MTAAPTTPMANADLTDLVKEMADMLRLEHPAKRLAERVNMTGKRVIMCHKSK